MPTIKAKGLRMFKTAAFKLELVLLLLVIIVSSQRAQAQFEFQVTPCQTADEVLALIDTVFLKGVNPQAIGSVTFSGDPTAVGYFTNAYFTGFSNPAGIIMTTGKSDDADKTNVCNSSQNASTDNNGVEGDPDLTDVGGVASHDGCIIEISFRPSADTVRFNYVFASEEYHEYVNGGVNDAFGFFLHGPGVTGPYTNDAANIALIPGTNMPVSINNVNFGSGGWTCEGKPGGCTNCVYFNDNSQQTDPAFHKMVYDGYTTNLMAKSATEQCEWYTIKLAIGDGGDGLWDSGVLLEKGSFNPGNVSAVPESSMPGVADSVLYESCMGQETVLYFSVAEPLGFPYVIPFQVHGDAERDIDYELFSTTQGDTIYIGTGELYDSIILRPYLDNDIEGIETIDIVFNPEMCNSFGSSYDTSRIYLSDVPDFNDTTLVFNSICEDTVTLGFGNALNGIEPYTYDWYTLGAHGPWVDYIITDTDSIAIPCLVTDVCGYQALNHAVVKVPDLNTDAGIDIYLCNVNDTMLNGVSPGAQHFQWDSDPNDPSLYVNNQDTLPNPVVGPVGTTTYTLLATDNCTNADEDEVLVSRDGLVAYAQGPDQACFGEEVMLVCTEGITHDWSCPTDPSIGSQDNDTIFVNPPAPGTYTYTVMVHDDCGHSDDTQVVVVVNSLPPAQADNGEVCFGQTYQLQEVGGGVAWQWNSIPSDPTLTTNGQDTLVNPVVTPPTQEEYRYWVTVTNQFGCVATDTMVLAVNPVPDLSLSTSHSILCHDSATTIEVIGNADLVWTANTPSGTASLQGQENNPVITVSPTETTIFTVTGTAVGFNCPASLTQTIEVKPELFSTFSTAAAEICEGDALAILYEGNATGNANYVWDFDDPANVFGSGSGPIDVVWDSAGIKNIWLTLTEDGCPSDTSFHTIEVLPTPMASFEGDLLEGCDPLTVQFDGSTSANLGTQIDWLWNFGDGQQSDELNPSHTYTQAGNYTVSLSLTNQGMCTHTANLTDYIVVRETPTADFDPQPAETILEDAHIQFENWSSSVDGVTSHWDFDDGSDSDETNPSHTYTAEGAYDVVLTVETPFGCVHDSSKQVLIRPDVAVYAPNAFTPNGDGINDFFEVKGAGLEKYKLQVYSRWGELMFESNDLSVQWDGTYKGVPVPGGTYVYHIYYTNLIHREYIDKGSVSVIR